MYDAIPKNGITFRDFAAKFPQPLNQHDKDELRRLLDPLATYDPSSDLWTPRPMREVTPGSAYSLISRPRTKQRVKPFASKWIAHSGEIITCVKGEYHPTWPEHTVKGLFSRQRVCYRNVVLTVLLNSSPAFLNFLYVHVTPTLSTTPTVCSIRDCLTCSLAELTSQYVMESDDNTNLENALDSFYDTCDKVFWGPRARAKHRIGPIHPDIEGDLDLSFMTWLLYEMREQLKRYPW